MSSDKLHLFLIFGLACVLVGAVFPALSWWARPPRLAFASGLSRLISSERFGAVSGMLALGIALSCLSGWTWRQLIYGALAAVVMPLILRRFSLASVLWSGVAILLATLLGTSRNLSHPEGA